MEAVYGCLREGRYGFLNPIMSGKLRTRTGIKYGKVEIVAKMPRGDWLWPGRIEIDYVKDNKSAFSLEAPGSLGIIL